MAMKIAKGQVYSRGGRYMGDPGLGSFLKKAAGVALSVIPGGGLVGGIIKTVGGAIIGGAAGGAIQKAATAPGGTTLPALPGVGQPIQVGPVGINVPFGGPPGVGVSIGNQHFGMTPVNGAGVPAGYRPNKSSYFLRDGTFVEKGSRLVKARRRNPLNPRAADRAISRLESAKKAATRLNRISIRKKKCCG